VRSGVCCGGSHRRRKDQWNKRGDKDERYETLWRLECGVTRRGMK
jgi:hypothetical protein